MENQVLEGTFADIQRQIMSLPFEPATRLRVIVTEPEAQGPERLRFQDAPRRNGFVQLKTRNPGQVITTEFVNDLLEE